MANITSIDCNKPRIATPAFERLELSHILDLYGRMVAAGISRDYSIDRARAWISFSVYRRASEMPEYRVVKEPALAARQGMWRLLGPGGAILKRGQSLATVLRPLEAKLIKRLNRVTV